MDVNWARSLFTVWVFVCFMLILFVVLNRRNKANYQDAADSIMRDDDTPHTDDSAPNETRDNGAK